MIEAFIKAGIALLTLVSGSLRGAQPDVALSITNQILAQTAVHNPNVNAQVQIPFAKTPSARPTFDG